MINAFQAYLLVTRRLSMTCSASGDYEATNGKSNSHYLVGIADFIVPATCNYDGASAQQHNRAWRIEDPRPKGASNSTILTCLAARCPRKLTFIPRMKKHPRHMPTMRTGYPNRCNGAAGSIVDEMPPRQRIGRCTGHGRPERMPLSRARGCVAQARIPSITVARQPNRREHIFHT